MKPVSVQHPHAQPSASSVGPFQLVGVCCVSGGQTGVGWTGGPLRLGWVGQYGLLGWRVPYLPASPRPAHTSPRPAPTRRASAIPATPRRPIEPMPGRPITAHPLACSARPGPARRHTLDQSAEPGHHQRRTHQLIGMWV